MALAFLEKHGFNLAEEVGKVHFGDGRDELEQTASNFPPLHKRAVKTIEGVRLPRRPYLWDIHIQQGKISEITPHNFNAPLQINEPNLLNARGCLIAPSLCHAHIHIDKCFLLQDPKFNDLEIIDGGFDEAMRLTSAAKQRFSRSDLLRRGRQLIIESIQAGVTAMRAFCEVDGVVGIKCLETGLQLKDEFKDRCDIQICAFAQLPLFSSKDEGVETRRLMETAAGYIGVDVLGSTPYVEDDEGREEQNLKWIIDLTLQSDKMLDLHLDYHLDQTKRPLVWTVFAALKEKGWMTKNRRQVTLGHCTRLTHFTSEDWAKVKQCISDLPISFVGLPTSDLFMMRTEQQWRGSLRVTELVQKHGLQACIAVNNVGNAFTPQGNCDPLSVASLGVGLFSAGRTADADLLYECVSSRAFEAIGMLSGTQDMRVGDVANFVIFQKSYTKMRTRKSIPEVVYDPPVARITIKNGLIVSK